MKSYIAEKKAAEVNSFILFHVQKKKNAGTDHTGSGEKRGYAENNHENEVNMSMKDQRAPPPMNVGTSVSV